MTWNTVSPEVSPESLKKNQNYVQFGLMLDFFLLENINLDASFI